VGPRAGLDTEVTGKILLPLPGIEPLSPAHPARSQTLYCLSYQAHKFHNEELHILYSSPNIIRQIKSRRMRWAGYVARMGEERNVYRFWRENQKERDHLED
jgi:hypothetical protein